MGKALLSIFFASFFLLSPSQNKKVLFEEFTGAYCGNCPEGIWVLDSLLKKHQDLIGVSLHSYGLSDAMFIPEEDTISQPYAGGSAPYAEVDRMRYGAALTLYPLMNRIDDWDSLVQVRLNTPADLTIIVTPSWNQATREITAQMDVNILNDLPNGDYRITVYVLEDSVSGTGAGYDQENFYDTFAGHPYFGMGNPIAGFVHRHVVREVLPQAWGKAGVIPAAPTSGQNFSWSVNYTLPGSIDENKVYLIGFVNRYSASHSTDEVLNADEVKLIPGTTGIVYGLDKEFGFNVYPNPSNAILKISAEKKGNYLIRIMNSVGQKVFEGEFSDAIELTQSQTGEGLFFFDIMKEDAVVGYGKFVMGR